MKMNIHRSNYETFFLMYVDNELSAAERKAVEEFVINNPDLQNEFTQFKELVLPTEEIIYTGKNNLYRLPKSSQLLNEKLLLHLDGELEAADIKVITPLIAPGGEMYLDWQILQQAKLNGEEHIVFPFKNLLYKKKNGKIVVVNFFKWAVAAAILGAVFFAGINFFNKNNPIIKTAKTTVPLKQNNNPRKTGPSSTAPDNTGAGINMTEKFTTAENAEPALQPKEKLPAQPAQVSRNLVNTHQKNKLIGLPLKKEMKTNNSEPLLAIQKDKNQVKIIGTQKLNANTLTPVTTGQVAASANTLSDTDLLLVENRSARTAGLNEVTNDKNANRILYLDEENVTRSKAGSFFKQLKRVIERNTKIKTDKGLRIGGFELAIK